MQFFKSVRRAPGRATPSKDGVALRRFEDHRFKLFVRRHALSSHEHIGLSSKSLRSCYTCAPTTDPQYSGGVAERLIAPVLKTGRPKGLVSSNLTPSANSPVRTDMVCGLSRLRPPSCELVLVGERLYLAGCDIRAVHKSN